MKLHQLTLTRAQTPLAILYYAASSLNHALHSYAFERLKRYNAMLPEIQPCIEFSRALVRTYSMHNCARSILIS